MSTVLTNRTRAGGFIQSEANFSRSRDRVTLAGGAGISSPPTGSRILAGTVLGQITAGGKYVPSAKTGSDGSQTAVAILFEDVDTTNGDVIGTVIARQAEVRAEDLTYDASVVSLSDQQAKWTQLATVGIIVHPMGGVQSS